MWKATKRDENRNLVIDLGSYADFADAVHAIKADYLSELFSSADSSAFLRGTGYNALRMERADTISVWTPECEYTWMVVRG